MSQGTQNKMKNCSMLQHRQMPVFIILNSGYRAWRKQLLLTQREGEGIFLTTRFSQRIKGALCFWKVLNCKQLYSKNTTEVIAYLHHRMGNVASSGFLGRGEKSILRNVLRSAFALYCLVIRMFVFSGKHSFPLLPDCSKHSYYLFGVSFIISSLYILVHYALCNAWSNRLEK